MSVCTHTHTQKDGGVSNNSVPTVITCNATLPMFDSPDNSAFTTKIIQHNTNSGKNGGN